MQIWAIGCWRNEADIARVNVLHHLSEGIDRFVILDDGSTDGTGDVLRALSRRHPIDVRRQRGTFRQDQIFSELAREAASRDVDWIIPVDADEFWYAPGAWVRGVLERTTAGALLVPVVNFVQCRSQIHRSDARILLTMTRTPRNRTLGVGSEDAVWANETAFVEYGYPGKWITRPSEMVAVGWGNHTVAGYQGSAASDAGIVCLHAPLRSQSMLRAKALGDRNEEEIQEYLDVAWHVRRWREIEKQGLLEKEWHANSYDDDELNVYGTPKRLDKDDRLRDLVERWTLFDREGQSDETCRPRFPTAVRVWGISVVRNEADVISASLRHQLSLGLERILVIDNGSSDGTPAILRALAADGQIETRRIEGAFRQDEMMTALAREAFEGGATWVLPFDADEFWYVTPPATLHTLLSQSNLAAIRCDVVNFVQAHSQRESSANSILNMRYRPARPCGPVTASRDLVESGKVAYVEAAYPGKWICRTSPFLRVERGAHSFDGLIGPVGHTAAITCLHAPLRSRAALTQKAEHGSRLEAQKLGSDIGWHVRRWSRLKSCADLDAEWAANSQQHGQFVVSSRTRGLIRDDTLVRCLAGVVTSEATGSSSFAKGPEAFKATVLSKADEDAIVRMMSEVDGWLSEAEARVLARAAARAASVGCPADADAVVEIGSFCGRSTIVLAAALQVISSASTVFAVDPHMGRLGAVDSSEGVTVREETFEEFRSNLIRHGLADRVEPIRLLSYEVPWARAIGLLFIDGLHDLASVDIDTRHFEPWVRTGGLIAFHDSTGPFVGVREVVEKALSSGRFRIVDSADSLVVLEKIKTEFGSEFGSMEAGVKTP